MNIIFSAFVALGVCASYCVGQGYDPVDPRVNRPPLGSLRDIPVPITDPLLVRNRGRTRPFGKGVIEEVGLRSSGIGLDRGPEIIDNIAGGIIGGPLGDIVGRGPLRGPVSTGGIASGRDIVLGVGTGLGGVGDIDLLSPGGAGRGGNRRRRRRRCRTRCRRARNARQICNNIFEEFDNLDGCRCRCMPQNGIGPAVF